MARATPGTSPGLLMPKSTPPSCGRQYRPWPTSNTMGKRSESKIGGGSVPPPSGDAPTGEGGDVGETGAPGEDDAVGVDRPVRGVDPDHTPGAQAHPRERHALVDLDTGTGQRHGVGRHIAGWVQKPVAGGEAGPQV